MNSESSPRSTDSTPENSEALPPSSPMMDEDSVTDELSSPSTASDHNTSDALVAEETQAEGGSTASGSIEGNPTTEVYRSWYSYRLPGDADNSVRYITLLTREQVANYQAGADAATVPNTNNNARLDDQVMSQEERDRRRLERLAPVFLYFVEGVLRANYLYKLRQRGGGKT